MSIFQIDNTNYPRLGHLQPSHACDHEDNSFNLHDVDKTVLKLIWISNNPDRRVYFPKYECRLRHWASETSQISETKPERILIDEAEENRPEVYYFACRSDTSACRVNLNGCLKK